MYKVTIKNPDQYSGFEVKFRELVEAADFVRHVTDYLPDNAEIEYHIEPVKAEGAEQ